VNYILYNPLSNRHSSIKKLNKLKAKLKIKNNKDYVIKSLLDILDISEFISSLDKNDTLIINGGDGTFNNIANSARNFKIPNEIYVYKAGTGNDFARNLKKTNRGLYKATKMFEDLPTVKFDSTERVFLNGCGLGVDALVCQRVNSTQIKNAANYFKTAFGAFKEYKPANYRTVVDGVETSYTNVNFAVVMHGKYQGGGMKFAPKQSFANPELTLVIVENINFFLLLALLPLIYLGWHGIAKKNIHFIKGKHFIIESEEPRYLQTDGEVFDDVKRIEVYK
jgi:diacylglycerol kinase family enzyme